MRYVKAFLIGLVALIGLIFIIQNIEVLKHPVKLMLNLYLINLETADIHLWVLVIFTFALGAFIVLLYFIYDHVKQRQTIRQLQHNIEIMSAELKRTGVAMQASAESLQAAASPEEPKEAQPQEEQHKEE